MTYRVSNIFSRWALAITILVGCSRSGGGSESNFVTCKDDMDCSAGTCVAGECKASTGGGGGATASSGAGPRTDAGSTTIPGDGGRQGNGGGCSAAGAYTLVAGAAGAGASAGGPGAPTCPVDADGVATVDQSTFCAMYRCPSTEAELVKAFTCTEATTDHDGVTITTGCGVQTVTIAGDGFSYSAHFTPGNNGPLALEARQPNNFGTCNAVAYRTGQAPPACASDATYKCRPTDPAGSGYSGCRRPGDPGCGTCCSPAVESSPQSGPACLISSARAESAEYYMYLAQFGACPCNCAACASCTPDLERRILTDVDGPVCDCSTIPDPPLGAGGSGTDPCLTYCPYIRKCNGIR